MNNRFTMKDEFIIIEYAMPSLTLIVANAGKFFNTGISPVIVEDFMLNESTKSFYYRHPKNPAMTYIQHGLDEARITRMLDKLYEMS